MAQWCIMTFINGHISKVKVKFGTFKICNQMYRNFKGTLDLDNTSHNSYQCSKSVSWPQPRSSPRSGPHSAYIANFCVQAIVFH